MAQKKSHLQSLNDQKAQLEQEIAEIQFKLKPYYAKGFDKSLIDEEGFPRADLDFGELCEYKNLKRTFNEKNNDHKDLMKSIEKALYDFHLDLKNDPNVEKQIEIYTQQHKLNQENINTNQQVMLQKVQQVNDVISTKQQQPKQQQQQQQQQPSEVHPFAIITEVSEGSPAFQAGIKLNDYILTFGKIDYSNHNNLNNLSTFVKENLNKPIQIQILRLVIPTEQIITDFRDESYLITNLKIVPGKWDGQGVLGCRFKCV